MIQLISKQWSMKPRTLGSLVMLGMGILLVALFAIVFLPAMFPILATSSIGVTIMNTLYAIAITAGTVTLTGVGGLFFYFVRESLRESDRIAADCESSMKSAQEAYEQDQQVANQYLAKKEGLLAKEEGLLDEEEELLTIWEAQLDRREALVKRKEKIVQRSADVQEKVVSIQAVQDEIKHQHVALERDITKLKEADQKLLQAIRELNNNIAIHLKNEFNEFDAVQPAASYTPAFFSNHEQGATNIVANGLPRVTHK